MFSFPQLYLLPPTGDAKMTLAYFFSPTSMGITIGAQKGGKINVLRLRIIGMPNDFITFIREWLTGRSFYVQVGGDC